MSVQRSSKNFSEWIRAIVAFGWCHRVDRSVGMEITKLLRADPIVIDDIGLMPVATETAEAFFRVYRRRLREPIDCNLVQSASGRI